MGVVGVRIKQNREVRRTLLKKLVEMCAWSSAQKDFLVAVFHLLEAERMYSLRPHRKLDEDWRLSPVSEGGGEQAPPVSRTDGGWI